MAEGSGEQNNAIILNQDSNVDIEITVPDIIGEEEYNVLFASEDDSESEFKGFEENIFPTKKSVE